MVGSAFIGKAGFVVQLIILAGGIAMFGPPNILQTVLTSSRELC